MKNTSQNIITSETSQKSQQTLFPILTSFVEDSLVSLSVSLGSEEDLKTQEAQCFFILRGLSRLKIPKLFSLRMLKDSSPMTMEEPLKQSSERLMSWGMMRNGVCLTASISLPHPDHESLSLRCTGTKKLMFGKGTSKPYRFTLPSARGFDLRMIPPEMKKLGEVPSELYEHLQNFPIGWTDGIVSTQRKARLGNAVTVNVIKAIMEKLT